MGLAPRTLKGQLTTLFLVLTLVPAIALTTIATRQLLWSLSLWHRPPVQHAMNGSLEMARQLMERTENDLRQRGQLLAADPVMTPPFTDPGTVEAIRNRLASAYNLDFMQVYSSGGELELEVTRDPQLVPSPGRLPRAEILARTENPFLEDADQDLLAHFGLAGAPGEQEWILAVGIYLDPGFYLRRDELTDALSFYTAMPRSIINKQRVIVVFYGLLILILAGASVWVARKLAQRVSLPVARLGEGMQRVARGEDARVAPQGTQETERLIETFNTMSTELSRSRRELARAERLAAWREVARRVAHEIKNALTPITFSASRLRKASAQVPEAERERFTGSVNTVLEEVEALKRLAASFSEMARLPIPDLLPLDLREVVRGAADAFTEEQRRMEVALPDDPVTVEGDRTLLRQALVNLVKNAVEATAGNQRIWIAVATDGRLARVTVEDEGPGWPEAEREASLDPYVTTKPDGTGLGLSLVQRTVLQHGGRLELEDRPGGGARVTLFLPHRSSLKVDGGPDGPIKERG
jgi:nitrogen fixation/metabolism regulation signal transduction histidine kinase